MHLHSVSPRPAPTRRAVLRGAGASVLVLGAAALSQGVRAQSAARIPKLVLAGPFAAVSNPLVRMVHAGSLRHMADTIELLTWKDPDQLRAIAVGAQADFVAMPSNVAANLYNRGVKLQLLNISAWGVLHMVSRDPALKTLADFRGKEVVMPFRNDMPEVVFRLLASRQGINASKDLQLRYVATPLDAMQLLLTRRASHALLAEPAVSVGLRKAQSFPVSAIAPQLYRSVDLQKEWGRLFQRPPRIPQAGMVVMGKHMGNTALIHAFQQAYAQALHWCQSQPDACGSLVAQRVPMLTAQGVADSVRVDNAAFVPAAQARPDLEFFYQHLMAQQPALVGGKLPDAGFYHAAAA